MMFIFTLLQKVAAGTDANRAARDAYTETLSKHHTYLVKKSFDVILMAAPSTPTMLSSLGSEAVRSHAPVRCRGSASPDPEAGHLPSKRSGVRA